MLSSRVKISCFRAKAHLVFHWCLYNKLIYIGIHGYTWNMYYISLHTIMIHFPSWEGSKLRRARKEMENAWHTFNISPSHFYLTSALEFEEKYKFVERKLKEDYERKKKLPKM